MRSISTSDWAKEEYTEPEQDQVLFHRLFPEWVPCISLHRHYRLSERGIYGELPLPENEISSKQGKRSCDGFPCLCWHWPIFPSRRQPSIFGTAELNFRVRNGNGWNLFAINTDSKKNGDPYQTRTGVAAVRGRSLNRLTNGPYWCTIGDSNPGPTD